MSILRVLPIIGMDSIRAISLEAECGAPSQVQLSQEYAKLLDVLKAQASEREQDVDTISVETAELYGEVQRNRCTEILYDLLAVEGCKTSFVRNSLAQDPSYNHQNWQKNIENAKPLRAVNQMWAEESRIQGARDAIEPFLSSTIDKPTATLQDARKVFNMVSNTIKEKILDGQFIQAEPLEVIPEGATQEQIDAIDEKNKPRRDQREKNKELAHKCLLNNGLQGIWKNDTDFGRASANANEQLMRVLFPQYDNDNKITGYTLGEFSAANMKYLPSMEFLAASCCFAMNMFDQEILTAINPDLAKTVTTNLSAILIHNGNIDDNLPECVCTTDIFLKYAARTFGAAAEKAEVDTVTGGIEICEKNATFKKPSEKLCDVIKQTAEYMIAQKVRNLFFDDFENSHPAASLLLRDASGKFPSSNGLNYIVKLGFAPGAVCYGGYKAGTLVVDMKKEKSANSMIKARDGTCHTLSPYACAVFSALSHPAVKKIVIEAPLNCNQGKAFSCDGNRFKVFTTQTPEESKKWTEHAMGFVQLLKSHRREVCGDELVVCHQGGNITETTSEEEMKRLYGTRMAREVGDYTLGSKASMFFVEQKRIDSSPLADQMVREINEEIAHFNAHTRSAVMDVIGHVIDNAHAKSVVMEMISDLTKSPVDVIVTDHHAKSYVMKMCGLAA